MRKILLLIVFSLLLTPALASAAGAYKNKLPKNSWAKYGVNPWRADTDSDGFADDWEVKNGYCPTNGVKGARLNSSLCQKGSYNLTTGKYTPPPKTASSKVRSVAVLPADKQRLADLKKLQIILSKYFKEQKMYPYGIGLPLGQDAYNCLNFDGWRQFEDCSYPYMYDVPLDPMRGSYLYTSTSTNSYIIEANLDGAINGLTGAIKLSPTGIFK